MVPMYEAVSDHVRRQVQRRIIIDTSRVSRSRARTSSSGSAGGGAAVDCSIRQVRPEATALVDVERRGV